MTRAAIALVLMACAGCWAQNADKDQPKINYHSMVPYGFTVNADPGPRFVIYAQPDKPLLEGWDDHGNLTLTVMRDGTVKTSADLDKLSRDFWKAFAAAMPKYCHAESQ